MSTRESLYNLYCLAAAARNVAQKSVPMASSAARSWFNASPLVASALDGCQAYRDPSWDAAMDLSRRIRRGNATGSVSTPPGKRMYSTSARTVCK